MEETQPNARGNVKQWSLLVLNRYENSEISYNLLNHPYSSWKVAIPEFVGYLTIAWVLLTTDKVKSRWMKEHN